MKKHRDPSISFVAQLLTVPCVGLPTYWFTENQPGAFRGGFKVALTQRPNGASSITVLATPYAKIINTNPEKPGTGVIPAGRRITL